MLKNKLDMLYLTPMFLIFLTLPLFSQTLPTDILQCEMELEKYVTDFIQKHIIDKMLGPDKAIAMVDLELAVETTYRTAEAGEFRAERKRRLGEIEYLLPGVPLPRSFTAPTVPEGESKRDSAEERQAELQSKITLRRKAVTIIHDKRIKQEKLLIVKDAITTVLALKPPADTIEFKPADFTPPILSPKLLQEILTPKYLIPLLLALFLLMFLFGPVASFLKNYLHTLKERGGTEVTIDSKMEGLPGTGAPGGPTAAELEKLKKEEEKEEEEEKKYKPFTYINEDNLKKLIYLIRKESPRTIAIILSYIKPEFIKEILEVLPPSLQAQVALNLGIVREINLEELMALDEEIKNKIDLIVGDPEQLVKIIEEADEVTRQNILDYLKSENPELYENVRKRIIIFDDIVNFPDLAVQTIIREVKIESLARVLRGAPAEVTNKILSNMSSGAAALLKEEMEYGRPITPEEIMEEKKKIIEIIKRLEQEGKIFIREKVKTLIITEITESIEEKASEFQKYYDYAVSLYDSGTYEESIPYFQYCLQLNPNSADVYQYLGNIYYSLGQFQEAISNYEKAVECNPENEQLKTFIEEIKTTLIV